MELLKQLLATAKVTVANLETEVKALGFDPVNLSEADAVTVAEKLKVTYSTKALNGCKKSQSNLPVEIATDKAVAKVDAMVNQYQQLADKVVEVKSSKIIAIIEDIPNATMNRVRQLLDDSEGNLDFFLNSVEDVQTAFLSKFNIE